MVWTVFSVPNMMVRRAKVGAADRSHLASGIITIVAVVVVVGR